MGLRKERLADEIRDLLAEHFVGERLQDPRVRGVTITSVKLSGDLQQANVYYRSYDESLKGEALVGLESCKGYLRRMLSDQLKVRRVPELRFIYDVSIEQGARIEHLLKKI